MTDIKDLIDGLDLPEEDPTPRFKGDFPEWLGNPEDIPSFSRVAVAEFRHLAPVLLEDGRLQPEYAGVFKRYCLAVQLFEETYPLITSEEVDNTILKVYTLAVRQLEQGERRFGLDPRSMSDLNLKTNVAPYASDFA